MRSLGSKWLTQHLKMAYSALEKTNFKNKKCASSLFLYGVFFSEQLAIGAHVLKNGT
jgi:hypothetical protein